MLQLEHWTLNQKRVFLRVDANVPIKDGAIQDDYRLIRMLRTLDALLSKGASVLLATHLGRPDGYNKQLSTNPIADWLIRRGYNAVFVEYEPNGYLIPTTRHGHNTVYVLDNLRFFKGETRCDPLFADLLRTYADYYVMDAFGAAHKASASTNMLAQRYDEEHRSLGYLIIEELTGLAPLKNIGLPLCAVLGGAKLKTKLRLINELILHRPRLTLFIGPALIFTLLKAQGIEVGASLVDEELIPLAHELLTNAEKYHVTIEYPVDYVSSINSLEGTLTSHLPTNFEPHFHGITVGPQTANAMKTILETSPLTFANPSMGLEERPETFGSAKEILTELAQNSDSDAYSVIAGGTTTQIAQQLNLLDKFSFVSTGGSAALAYIANQPMHGLEPFD